MLTSEIGRRIDLIDRNLEEYDLIAAYSNIDKLYVDFIQSLADEKQIKELKERCDNLEDYLKYIEMQANLILTARQLKWPEWSEWPEWLE